MRRAVWDKNAADGGRNCSGDYEANQVTIRVYLNPLEEDTEFLHLGRTTAYKNSEWEALYSNR